jgi:hypothetical protein
MDESAVMSDLITGCSAYSWRKLAHNAEDERMVFASSTETIVEATVSILMA